ncbi:DUF5005 domain-containing protein [Mucilaginibacter hurinus]|nr:DUF5005 domain-containing protein [Mucilaginibacter hurinus]
MSKYIIALACLSITIASCKKRNENPAKSAGNNILSFTINNSQVGEAVLNADSATIRIFVKQGTDLTTIKPEIRVADKASISPASGQQVNLLPDSVITYTVTAESGATQKWQVQVKIYPKPNLASYKPDVKPDSVFQGYFTRYNGWNSGDGAQSILLPDGRTVWMFGDSFVGEVNPDRTRVNNKTWFINNVMMIQQGSEFTTHHGGTSDKPTALFVPDNPKRFYWARHGFVDGNELYLTLMELEKVKVNGRDELAHHADKMAVLSLPDMRYIKMLDIPYRNGISYGDRCFSDGNYNYMFGQKGNGWNNYLYIARAAAGKAKDTWEFFAGDKGWVKDMSSATTIKMATHISSAPTLINRNGRYYMIIHRNFFSNDILMFRADKPEGPYTDEVKLYTTTDADNSYLAIGHPQFMEGNRLLIGYSVAGDIFKSYKNVDICVPKFIRVTLPE